MFLDLGARGGELGLGVHRADVGVELDAHAVAAELDLEHEDGAQRERPARLAPRVGERARADHVAAVRFDTAHQLGLRPPPRAKVLRTAGDGTPVVVTSNGQPIAAVISIEQLHVLEHARTETLAEVIERTPVAPERGRSAGP